eukprot:1040907-Pleurochrysis_carterae.AAC.1
MAAPRRRRRSAPRPPSAAPPWPTPRSSGRVVLPANAHVDGHHRRALGLELRRERRARRAVA